MRIFLRAYFQGESRTTYKKAFERCFSVLEQAVEQSITWQHIHGYGTDAVSMDMSDAQALGKYIYIK